MKRRRRMLLPDGAVYYVPGILERTVLLANPYYATAFGDHFKTACAVAKKSTQECYKFLKTVQRLQGRP